ncbi:MlaA family lipoprotein [Cochlodiniinecator piscidefendens]|uniref:MlaA family lipoprotein n=1 Tax=Cochlodiniinecator piscidefendens TaxID=2715756 RepID=UPI00140A2912|nr:VacJ family lipoprotein [Cochlodiniinecator piscidefendens]
MAPKLVNFAALAGILFLGACTNPENVGGIQDPYETLNRGVHEENRNIDDDVLRPVSNAYGENVSRPLRRGVANFASNLSLPGKVVNNLLQGDLEGAVRNSFRFAFNSTIGLGGVLDPAYEMGLPEEDTDFGETLYVWGVPEGNFVELPLLGPSTERHMAGRFVDLFTNPLGYVIESPANYLVIGANALSRIDDRYEYSETVDSILYESEDSYSAARLIYLENRRFELGAEVSEQEVDEIDALFDDLYGE